MVKFRIVLDVSGTMERKASAKSARALKTAAHVALLAAQAAAVVADPASAASPQAAVAAVDQAGPETSPAAFAAAYGAEDARAVAVSR